MRYLPIILVFVLMFVPLGVSAQGAVIVVIDALGSSYLSPGMATYAEGTPITSHDMKFVDRADARYQLKVPVPATEYGHAVIVTGYSEADHETVAYFNATIFDALKNDGYVALGILENGDSREMLGEMDAVVRDKNGSVNSPYCEFIQHGTKVPPDVAEMMKNYPGMEKVKAGKGKDKYAPYIRYNNWSLDFTTALVKYINHTEPDLNYILLVNAGGLDHSGHLTGCEGYGTVLSGLEPGMESLIDACKGSGTILVVTGDHGMSFSEDSSRGSHENGEAASRNESLLTPLLIYSNKTLKGTGGTYGQECLAPTVLSLLDEPNTMSLGDGEPLPVKEKPTLFLRSNGPESVVITGKDYKLTASIDGIYRLDGLEKGDYIVSYDKGEIKVHLTHDELVDILEKNTQRPPILPIWAIYLIIAIVAVIGMLAALKLAWMRK
jgi:bisphosphoglycerate-independent phosphoglycerate mutase (AlkP superfamily)